MHDYTSKIAEVALESKALHDLRFASFKDRMMEYEERDGRRDGD